MIVTPLTTPGKWDEEGRMGKMEGRRLSALRTFELELKGTWEVFCSDFPSNNGLSLTRGHSASSKLAPSITEQL